MKTITFYNEKGGVGKSSFSILYASWLSYKYGIKVGVTDFNNRLATYRNDEKIFLKSMNSFDKYASVNPWPIINEDMREVLQYNYPLMGHALWFDKECREGQLKNLDVIILDFPGAVSGEEVIQMTMSKNISLCVIPTDRDEQTVRATLGTTRILLKTNTPFCLFMNQIQPFTDKKVYVKTMETYKRKQFRILPDMVSFSERMRKLSENDTMRSTFSYPDWESPSFTGSKDLGIENLFIDITRELNKCPDIKGTQKTNLSFVNSLKKDTSLQSLNRQLNGTAFPEYEIPLPEDMKLSFKKNR
jgi:cellulose biosynthesis protein BcsQ